MIPSSAPLVFHTDYLGRSDGVVAGAVSPQAGSVELPHISPSLNASFTPMDGEPSEVKDIIWKRVLYFALSVPELPQNVDRQKVSPRLPLLLVSKSFYVRVLRKRIYVMR